MAMAPDGGSVSVDDDGNATYTPDDATNLAKAFYLKLVDDASTSTRPSTTQTPPEVDIDDDGNITQTPGTITTVDVPIGEPSPAAKKEHAKLANTMAGTLVPYLIANATPTITIPASAAGDGLQTTTTTGNPTSAPASPKVLTGALT